MNTPNRSKVIHNVDELNETLYMINEDMEGLRYTMQTIPLTEEIKSGEYDFRIMELLKDVRRYIEDLALVNDKYLLSIMDGRKNNEIV